MPLTLLSFFTIITFSVTNGEEIGLKNLLRKDPSIQNTLSDSSEIHSLDELIQPYRGKVIYLDIWATWCGPCRQEFVQKDELMQFVKGRDIQLIYVSVDEPEMEDYWKKTIAQYELKGKHVLAGRRLEDELRREFGFGYTLRLPTYVIIDKKGKIVDRGAPRPSSGKKLFRKLEKYLKR